jgi:hypothetical protein
MLTIAGADQPHSAIQLVRPDGACSVSVSDHGVDFNGFHQPKVPSWFFASKFMGICSWILELRMWGAS